MLALALLSLLIPAGPRADELDREALVERLSYGQNFDFRLSLSTAELPGSKNPLAELIDQYSDEGGADHPAAHLAKALEALRNEDVEGLRTHIVSALRGFQPLLERPDPEPDLVYLAGLAMGVYARAGGRSDALEAGQRLLRRLLENEPDHWMAAVELAQMLRWSAGRAMAEGDDEAAAESLDDAIDVLEEAIDEAPDEYGTHSALDACRVARLNLDGVELDSADYWDELRGITTEAREAADLHREPVAARSAANLILLLPLFPKFMSRETESALPAALAPILAEMRDDFEELEELAVFEARARALGWLVRVMRGDEDEAEAFERALETADDPRILHVVRLRIAEQIADCGLALAAVELALAEELADEMETGIRVAAAESLRKCDEPERGEALLRELSEEESDAPAAWTALGIYLLKTASETEDAISALRRASELDEENGHARFALGTALALAGELSAALEELELAAELLEKTDHVDDTIEEIEEALADEE